MAYILLPIELYEYEGIICKGSHEAAIVADRLFNKVQELLGVGEGL
jgi:hypothetical protein